MASEKLLFLLRPENLSSCQLSDNFHRDKLDRVLSLFAAAVIEPIHEYALIKINHAIEILDVVRLIRNQKLVSSSTSLEPWEIQDFDNFFNIEHIETLDSAACLVLSILTAYQVWLELIINSNSTLLTEEQLVIQKTGFHSSINLLCRLFDLPVDKYYE